MSRFEISGKVKKVSYNDKRTEVGRSGKGDRYMERGMNQNSSL
jgi:hypothetical protein